MSELNALEDEYTGKIADLNAKIAEYEYLIAHLSTHDCSKEEFVKKWSEANLQYLRKDPETGSWYFEWSCERSFTDPLKGVINGPDPAKARALNAAAEAAYRHAKAIAQDLPTFGSLQECTFSHGRIVSYKQ